MSLPILYIAGPMTGDENFNYPAFFSAAQILEDVGYTVINPADIGMHPEWTHAQYLRLSLTRLIEGGLNSLIVICLKLSYTNQYG